MNKILQSQAGIELYLDIYERGKKDWLVVTHGIGEHSGRHHYLKHLFSEFYNILFWDLRGHGKSTGKRAYIDDFNQYSEDQLKVLRFLEDEYRAENFTLFGHSMGSLITANTIQNFNYGSRVSKVYLSSPPVEVPGAGRIAKILPKKWLSGLANLDFSLAIPGLIDKDGLSHDPEVIDLYERDPLNCMSLHSKLLFQLAVTSNRVFSKPLNFNGLMFASVGGNDTVVDPKAVVHYFKAINPVTDFCYLPGARHEIHNEIAVYQKPYFEFLKKSLIRS